MIRVCSSTRHSVFGIASTRRTDQRPPTRRPRSSSEKDNGGVDWDGAWTDFQQQQQQEEGGGGGGGGNRSSSTSSNNSSNRGGGKQSRAGRQGARRPSSGPRKKSASSPLDEIKRQEDAALSPWSSALFAQLGVAAVVLLLLAMISVAGSEIHDDRCTLPWC